MERIRKLISYKKMSPEIKALYKTNYPNGYSDDDVQRVNKSGDETLFVLPLESGDATYLIKVDIFKKRYKIKKRLKSEDYDMGDADYDFDDNSMNPYPEVD